MTSSPWIENVKELETSARTFSAIPSDRIWAKRRAALNFSARMSRRKMPAHLSSLYLTMLMSDIDFSRMSAKASDKGPPYGGGCLLKHHPFSRCGSPSKRVG